MLQPNLGGTPLDSFGDIVGEGAIHEFI